MFWGQQLRWRDFFGYCFRRALKFVMLSRSWAGRVIEGIYFGQPQDVSARGPTPLSRKAGPSELHFRIGGIQFFHWPPCLVEDERVGSNRLLIVWGGGAFLGHRAPRKGMVRYAEEWNSVDPGVEIMWIRRISCGLKYRRRVRAHRGRWLAFGVLKILLLRARRSMCQF